MKKSSYTTPARTHILDVLQAASDRTVTAAELLAALRAQGTPVNKTTVYRNLDKLVAEGAVLRYTDESGERAGYQFVGGEGGCHGHLHLKCTGCGRVYHLDCGFMDEIHRHIHAHHGFSLKCESSVLFGVCKNCHAQNAESSTIL